MRKYLSRVMLLISGLAISTPGMTENLNLTDGEMAVSAAPSIDLPVRGSSMSAVRSKFGEPVSQTGPVGTPPISRWDYTDFVVVFEGEAVLHSLVPGNLHPVVTTP
jgi:hypothetical protein